MVLTIIARLRDIARGDMLVCVFVLRLIDQANFFGRSETVLFGET
jgi:hypothetical protein